MHKSTNEAPPIFPRLWIANRASECVNWLKVQGYEVLNVEAGPRVIIRACALCDELEGAVVCYSRSLHSEHRYKMVMRFGVEVRWADKRGDA